MNAALNEADTVDVARAIVRAEYRALLPVIEETRVETVSTHAIASATEPANFVHDGHFTPEIDVRIGAALAARINATLQRSPH